MNRAIVCQQIKAAGLIAVIRASMTEDALRLAEALIEGGVRDLEITFTVPGAHHVIETLVKRFCASGIRIGAGTVLDGETARLAILSGAQFIVSPGLSREVLTMGHRYGSLVMPGIMTVTEAMQALELGADLLKLFPANVLGPKFLQALRAPLPQAEIVPTGGIGPEQAREWILAGATAVGIGNIFSDASVDASIITERARKTVTAIREARELHG